MLTIFTPTRHRPKTFALLERYVERQKGNIPWRWIVACDGGVDDYNFTMGQEVIVREHVEGWIHSLNANYLACSEAAEDAEKIICLEDDDWYHPEYFLHMDRWLDEFDLVGIARNRYYHVPNKAYCVMPNVLTSAMGTTGFTKKVIPSFQMQCLLGSPYVDWHLWGSYEGKKKLFPDYNFLQVGIKGSIEHGGIGIGHSLCEPKDEDGSVFREWFGEDAAVYDELFSSRPCPEVLQ